MHRRTTSRALAVAAAAALVLGLAACGDDDDTSADETPTTEAADDTTTTAADAGDDAGGDDAAAGDATVVISGFTFEVPDSVSPGATVTVDNQDSAPHTATADDDAFDSGSVAGGSTGTFTAPAEAGSYALHCEIHPDMTATLTVA